MVSGRLCVHSSLHEWRAGAEQGRLVFIALCFPHQIYGENLHDVLQVLYKNVGGFGLNSGCI